MKNILVTGHTGFLGHYICNLGLQQSFQVTGLSRGITENPEIQDLQADLSKLGFIESLEKLNFDGMIHLAANSNVNSCEKNPEASAVLNVQASVRLAQFAASKKIPFVFTSSDQVFDGKKGAYSKADKALPLNAYGRQKLAAEKLISREYPKAVICRMPLMIGEVGGYEKAFVENVKTGKAQTLFTDEIRSVLEASEAAEKLLAALNWEGGIYHLPGPVDMNRYQLGLMLAKKHGLDMSLLQKGKQSDVKMSAKRPKNVTMV